MNKQKLKNRDKPIIGIVPLVDLQRESYWMLAPFKVLNMILGGGIIRSGGKTKYVMIIDMIGTWGLGIPLGLIGAFVLRLSIAPVYFILSLEECVRFGISVFVLRRKNWMKQL